MPVEFRNLARQHPDHARALSLRVHHGERVPRHALGATSNLIGRVIQHRHEAFGGFTAEHSCKRLVWYDAADTMPDAIAHEKRLKRWRRDWKIALIERTNPTWDDLAIALGLPPRKQ